MYNKIQKGHKALGTLIWKHWPNRGCSHAILENRNVGPNWRTR